MYLRKIVTPLYYTKAVTTQEKGKEKGNSISVTDGVTRQQVSR